MSHQHTSQQFVSSHPSNLFLSFSVPNRLRNARKTTHNSYRCVANQGRQLGEQKQNGVPPKRCRHWCGREKVAEEKGFNRGREEKTRRRRGPRKEEGNNARAGAVCGVGQMGWWSAAGQRNNSAACRLRRPFVRGSATRAAS